MVDNFASVSKCMSVGRTSNSMMDPTLSYLFYLVGPELVLFVAWSLEFQLDIFSASYFRVVLFDTQGISRPRGYKTFSMLNSTEHEIFPTHKC